MARAEPESGAGAAVGAGEAPAAPVRRKRGVKPISLHPSLSLTSNSTRILDWLVLGGQEAAADTATLKAMGVTHVLNVSKDCKIHFPEDFKYLRIPIGDTTTADAKCYFEQANAFIEAARKDGGTVLVHCQSGMSRSTTMVLAHMLMSMNMSLKDAFAHVKGRRKRAAPNSGFCSQLVELERELRGSATVNVDVYRDHRFDEVDVFAIPDIVEVEETGEEDEEDSKMGE